MFKRIILSLYRRRQMEAELENEIEFDISERVDRYVAEGMTEAAARARVRLEFGGAGQIKDECRDVRPLAWLDEFHRDLSYAFRSLRLNPGFALVAILTMTLAIGANTTIFSVVNSVLFHALPYRDSGRIAVLLSTSQKALYPEHTSVPNFEDWRVQSHTIREFAFYSGPEHATLSQPGIDRAPEMIWFSWVSPHFLPLLGVAPAMGRAFSEEESANGAPVAVVSHRLWRHIGAQPSDLGRNINLGSEQFQVIGVMPDGFELPRHDVDVWLPVAANGRWPALRADRQRAEAVVMGRLAAGRTIAQAQFEMSAIAANLAQQHPAANADVSVRVVPLHVHVLGESLPLMLTVLLGAVGFVLLIACTNVANLLLARASAREREIAIRISLGASRARLVRQMLTESLTLACIAGIAGLLFACLGVKIARETALLNLPQLAAVAVDARVLAFALAITVFSGLLFGLAPAVRTSRVRSQNALATRTRAAASPRSRGALVVVEFALAVVLLTGAGLMIRSFVALISVDPGFRPQGVLTTRLTLRNPAFYAEVLERLRALPGVRAVGGINSIMNLGGTLDPDMDTIVTVTAGDAFLALGIPLVKGRYFVERDSQASSPSVMLVNESYARRFWPGADPIGRTQRVRDEVYTVVGILRDIHNGGIERPPVPQFFPAPGPRTKLPATLIVRAAGDANALAGAVRATVHSIDPGAVVWNMATLEKEIDSQVAQRRFLAWLLGAFAIVALALAGVGIYGLLHYSVSRRTHEIGVRMALGATGASVRRMVLRQGLSLAVLGIGIGLFGAAALTRSISSLLFGVTPTDPFTFTAVGITLVAIALAACFIPAWHATRVDPLVALRFE